MLVCKVKKNCGGISILSTQGHSTSIICILLYTKQFINGAITLLVHAKVMSQSFFIFLGIRLAGASRPTEGRVEVFSHGSWGTICGERFDMIDADVICKELGYAKASSKKVTINKSADPSM